MDKPGVIGLVRVAQITAQRRLIRDKTLVLTVLAFGSRASSDFGVFAPADDTQRSGTIAYFYGPYLTQPTAFRSVSAAGYLNAWMSDQASTHNQSTAYDGFNLYTFTGSVSGRVAVYGMRK